MPPAIRKPAMTSHASVVRMLFGCILLLAFGSRAPAGVGSATEAPGIRTLYLVRHGLYDENDRRDAEVGKALVPLGREQAKLVAARLAALPEPPTTVYSSTMTRAKETAAIVGAALHREPQAVRELSECTPATRRADIMAGLRPGEADSCATQIEGAFARFFTPSPAGDASDVLVCHGNVIRYCVCRALGVDPLAWLGMTIANCSLTVIQVKPDGSMRLVSYDDVGHIPPAQQTYTSPSKKAAMPAGAPVK